MNQVSEKMRVVPVPESAKAYLRCGTLGVQEHWIVKEAEVIHQRDRRHCRHRRHRQAMFPLKLAKPDTVLYRKQDGQIVEVKLPRKPFQLLEFVMGQQGMMEDLLTISAVVWNSARNCTKAIDQAKMRVNEHFLKAGIPFRLFRKNGYVILKKIKIKLPENKNSLLENKKTKK